MRPRTDSMISGRASMGGAAAVSPRAPWLETTDRRGPFSTHTSVLVRQGRPYEDLMAREVRTRLKKSPPPGHFADSMGQRGQVDPVVVGPAPRARTIPGWWQSWQFLGPRGAQPMNSVSWLRPATRSNGTTKHR